MNLDFPFHVDDRRRTAETGTDDHIRDLIEQVLFTAPGEVAEQQVKVDDLDDALVKLRDRAAATDGALGIEEIGRASCRERVCNDV